MDVYNNILRSKYILQSTLKYISCMGGVGMGTGNEGHLRVAPPGPGCSDSRKTRSWSAASGDLNGAYGATCGRVYVTGEEVRLVCLDGRSGPFFQTGGREGGTCGAMCVHTTSRASA